MQHKLNECRDGSDSIPTATQRLLTECLVVGMPCMRWINTAPVYDTDGQARIHMDAGYRVWHINALKSTHEGDCVHLTPALDL